MQIDAAKAKRDSRDWLSRFAFNESFVAETACMSMIALPILQQTGLRSGKYDSPTIFEINNLNFPD